MIRYYLYIIPGLSKLQIVNEVEFVVFSVRASDSAVHFLAHVILQRCLVPERAIMAKFLITTTKFNVANGLSRSLSHSHSLFLSLEILLAVEAD